MSAPSDAVERRPPATTRTRTVGIACAMLSVLMFASFTLVSRLGLSSSLRFADLAALRFGISGLLLFPVLLRHRRSAVRLRDAGLLACSGGVGFALLAYAGFALAPAAHGAVLLHGSLPLFTFAILGATSRQWPTRVQLLGLGLITAGVALMALDSWIGASASQLVGDGCLLLASASWSVYGVRARHLGLAPAHAAAIVASLSMCVFLPGYAFLPGRALQQVSARELLLQAAFQGGLIGVLSLFIYTRAVTTLGPATTALFTAAVPGLTTLAALPLLSELPSHAGVAGVGIVTLGMLVAARGQRGGRSAMGAGARRSGGP